MALPASVTLRPLELTSATAGTGGTVVLNFVIQSIANSSMTQWDDDAVAASVAAFFNYTTRWTQCQIASTVTGQSCCVTSPPSACNSTSLTLSRCLTTIGSLASSGTTATFDQIMTAIDGGAPLGVVLANPYTPLAIYGYTNPGSGGGAIFIGDPVRGYTIVNYAAFPTGYIPGATWSSTYWTRQANG